MSRETQLKDSGFSFDADYQPTPWVVDPADRGLLPDARIVDFSPDGAYSPYNWELFFHAPLLIANALSQNQRFEEARDWFHFIFNPIGVAEPGAGRLADEQVLDHQAVLRDHRPQYVQQRIENILRMLAGDTSVPGYSAAEEELEDQVLDWRTNPFEPHRIANYRTVAYQKTVVMKYLDNLIAWGDHLFRQDSIESINEATQLYVLAAEILGPAAEEGPAAGEAAGRRPSTSWRRQLDDFSNALVEVENLVPPLPGNGGSAARPGAAADALLLHPAQRQAAGLLGHGRRPALQDPPLHEHRGRGAAAGAVRAADRSRRAGQGGRRRRRHRHRARRPERAAAALPLQRAAAEGQRGLQRRRRRSAARCSPRWRRRTPRRWACCGKARRSACSKR